MLKFKYACDIFCSLLSIALIYVGKNITIFSETHLNWLFKGNSAEIVLRKVLLFYFHTLSHRLVVDAGFFSQNELVPYYDENDSRLHIDFPFCVFAFIFHHLHPTICINWYSFTPLAMMFSCCCVLFYYTNCLPWPMHN